MGVIAFSPGTPSTMRLLKKLFLLLLIAVPVGAVVSLFMMVEDQPLAGTSASFSTEDLTQAQVFVENTDPRNLLPGEVTAFTVNERDLELVIGYVLSQLNGGGATVQFSNGLAQVGISGRLPDNPLGEYLNVQAEVSQTGAVLAVESLQIGGVRIPGVLIDPVVQFAHEQLQQSPEYVAVLAAINGYSISPGQINVVYQWQPDLFEQISNRGRDLLISPEDQERLLAHASNLSAITNDSQFDRDVSVAEFLSPMMLFAKVRGGDPVEENRAAILALSMYVMGVSVPRVLGLPRDSVPPMGRHQLLLSERHDFAQHFLVSAALTVSSGTGVADSIGLLKELDDSQGGSGFSFTDIGADRTGVRFAELAIANTQTARAVQDKFSYGLPESDLMAEFRDLPEFLDEATFRRIYGGVGTPAYNRVIDDIENRISNTRFFAELDR